MCKQSCIIERRYYEIGSGYQIRTQAKQKTEKQLTMILVLVHPLVPVVGGDELVAAEARVYERVDERRGEVLPRRVHVVLRQ